MILDYREFITRKGASGIELGVHKEENIDLFYKDEEFCPFCNIKINNLKFSKSKTVYPDWLEGSFSEFEKVYQCPTCGWWEHIYRNSSDAMLDYIRLSEVKIHTSVLKKYDVDSKVVPIEVLANYIRENPTKIYNIHHKKMEELTQSVFKEHYNCEVEMVGKSHDGGKDLILVNGEEPTIIQVKRRTMPDKVEPVSSIRELLGTTVLASSKSCIFVTTANHFSKMAVEEAEKAKSLKIVEKYDLINFNRFIDMLGLRNNNRINKEYWSELVQLKSTNYI